MNTSAEFTIGAGRVTLTGDRTKDETALRIIAACASPMRAAIREYAAYGAVDVDLDILPAPMTWAEAWTIDSDEVRAAAMSACRCDLDLMDKLNGERIHTDGIERPGLRWGRDGRPLPPKPYTAIYELWRADLSKVAPDAGIAYVVRCWCTTTGGEAWIWCGEPKKGDKTPAITAIASTFVVPKKALDVGCKLMRQGDLMLVITSDPTLLEGDAVPLTADQYRDLLVAES